MTATNSQTQTEQTQTEAPRLGVPTVSNILHLLLEKAADNLTEHELSWLSTGASETVYCEIDNLHTVVNGIAGLVSEDGNAGNFQSQKEVGGLMWSIAHQLDVIRGLETLSNNAKVRNEAKQYAKNQA